MSWVALKMLMGDRAKFLGIVLGLTFAALLITQQVSIFCGLMLRTAGRITDTTGSDLWVMDPNVRYVDDVKPMIENNLYRVRGVEGVKWAVPLYKGSARARLVSEGRVSAESGGRGNRGETFEVIEQIILLGLDDTSLVGAPTASRMLAGRVEDLRGPDAILIDFHRLDKLYPGENWSLERFHGADVHLVDETTRREFEASYGRLPIGRDGKVNFYTLFLGRELEMNDHRAVIVGVCDATRTFQSNAIVTTTYNRARHFVPPERKPLSYILASAEGADDPGISRSRREDRARSVAERIERTTGLRARTSEQFTWMTMDYYLRYTGIPINFGITTALGFLVGTAIAGQTFYNFTIDNLRQFGSLKAMGASNGRIVAMVLLQAGVSGLVGYGLGVGLSALFGLAIDGGELAFHTPLLLLPITGAAIVAICLMASVFSIRRVLVVEPAIVFRT